MKNLKFYPVRFLHLAHRSISNVCFQRCPKIERDKQFFAFEEEDVNLPSADAHPRTCSR